MQLAYHPDRVALRVSDDGRGFDPGDAGGGGPRGAGGFGLAGLRQRVGQVGGSVELVTAPGAGVTLLVEIGS